MGDALLTAARWSLGIGLISLLATIALLASPTLRNRISLAPRLAFAWTFTWLALGMLLRACSSQQIWGQPWRWAQGDAWSLVALLALVGSRQVGGRWRLAWLSLSLLAGVLALIALIAA